MNLFKFWADPAPTVRYILNQKNPPVFRTIYNGCQFSLTLVIFSAVINYPAVSLHCTY